MSAHHLSQFEAIVGPAYCLTDAGEMPDFTTDYRKIYVGRAMAVVRPAHTQQVSDVMRYCHQNDITVVPQGGNTSLLGGAVPAVDRYDLPCVVLSLARLNRVLSIDTTNNTMLVEAGVTLNDAREAAGSEQRLFPLRIGSEGTCQIGGNLSTNAGGTAVLRYGNMRDLVLGLEVVLPDGAIWNGLRALRGDNAGYDLKHVFIGSEGTLGIINAAVLKLFPQPRSTSTALLATKDPESAVALLSHLKSRLGNDITAFELISAPALELVLAHMNPGESLFRAHHDWMILIEVVSNLPQTDADEAFQGALNDTYESGLVLDALLASSESAARRFWQLREEISDAQTRTGGSVRCDISVPLSAIPEFILEASAQVLRIEPRTRMVIYGHLGDGNVHFNPLRPADMPAADFMAANSKRITQVVDDLAMSMDGSISAEHGVGVAKRDELLQVKSEPELLICWRIKKALDPKGLLNPGKVLPVLRSATGSIA